MGDRSEGTRERSTLHVTRWSFLPVPDTSEALGKSTQLGGEYNPLLAGEPQNGLESVSPGPHFFGGLHSPIGTKLEMSSSRCSRPDPDPPLKKQKNSHPKQGWVGGGGRGPPPPKAMIGGDGGAGSSP